MQGFPTIKAFVNGRMIDYNGDRSAGHLKDWAISLIPQKVRARLTTGPQFGVALLFHRMIDEHMRGCYHLFVILLVTVLSSGSQLGGFLQRCMGPMERRRRAPGLAQTHEAFMGRAWDTESYVT